MTRELKRLDENTVALVEGDRVLAKYVDGCGFCRIEKEQMRWHFPPHEPSKMCESGGEAHCSCSRCF